MACEVCSKTEGITKCPNCGKEFCKQHLQAFQYTGRDNPDPTPKHSKAVMCQG
jgi:hypothetical protein